MSESLNRLIHELSKLPGIGKRSATRLAFHILRQPTTFAQSLSEALMDVKQKVVLCSRCQNLTEVDPCKVCCDHKRENKSICVVEEASDLMAIERTRAYRGRYHVLHGVISPLDGIGPDDIKAADLIKRIEREEMDEIILATNSDVEGEATALYLTRLIKPTGVKVTRLATGIPVGGELEYIDPNTLSSAFLHRKEL